MHRTAASARVLAAIALACVLLGARLALAVHPYEHDARGIPDACEECDVAAQGKTALPSALAAPPPWPRGLAAAAMPATPSRALLAPALRARGPPLPHRA